MNAFSKSGLLETSLRFLCLVAICVAAAGFPALAQVPNDPAAKKAMEQQLVQEIADLEKKRANGTLDPGFETQRLAAARAMLAAIRGGAGNAGGNGAPKVVEPPRKKPTPVRPDPNNPWTLPGAMWSQTADGKYEYYRLEKGKDGRNQTITVVPTVTKDGRVIWTDKK